jgi:hypothetical protein
MTSTMTANLQNLTHTTGFFDLQQRYEGLDAKSDPLVAILAAVPFELFRLKLKTALVRGGLRRVASRGTRC